MDHTTVSPASSTPEPIFYPGRDRSFNLESPKSAKMPTKVCALYIKSTWDRLSLNCLPITSRDVSRGFVRSIDGLFWNYKHDKATRAESFRAFRPRVWWDNLYLRAKSGGTLWIFCFDAWPYWCLLKGKEEVDAGRLLLDLMPDDTINESFGQRARRGSGLFVVQNPPTIICLAIPGGGRLKIIDLRNYGIEPKDMPCFVDEVNIDVVRSAIVGYRELLQAHDLGSWQTTAASQAWYAFRRSSLIHKVQVNPIKKCIDLEQFCYYGGRCEVRRMGKLNGLTYHLDVNSMYTSIASCLPFPSRHLATVLECSQQDALNHLIDHIGAADITVEIDKPTLPCGERCLSDPLGRPERKTREHVIFPLGRFRTGLCGSELAFALANYKCTIHRLQVYCSEMILQKWGLFALSARREVRDSLLAHMEPCFKKIINCLPGKFGQRQKLWLPCTDKKTVREREEEKDLWIQEWGFHPVTDELTQYRTIANNTEYLDDEMLAPLSCPIISAVWTAYGRMFLWGAMECVGQENIAYYDTDSLIVNAAGFKLATEAGMIDQAAPMKWKVKEVSDDVEIHGIRRYRFGKRFCVAGPFGKELIGNTTPVAWLEHENFVTQMQHGDACDSVQVEKHASLSNCYKHGVVGKGGLVTPHWAGSKLVVNDET